IIGHHNVGRPDHIIGGCDVRLFFDVDFGRNEMLADVRGDPIIWIRHGIHGHAGPSHWRCAEVEQDRLALLAGPRLGLIQRCFPNEAVGLSCHRLYLLHEELWVSPLATSSTIILSLPSRLWIDSPDDFGSASNRPDTGDAPLAARAASLSRQVVRP